jgi:RHS repeat-associated protein
MADSVANQTVSYSYDSLNRLASATATGGSAWSQAYSFDGFGNLTGNGNWTQSVNAANNQITTVSYDANGNQTQSAIVGQSGNATLSYDVENRLTAMVYGTNPQVTIGQYAYNPSNQRVWRKAVESGVTAEYFYFYGINGKREATYKVTSNAPTGLNSYRAALVGTAQDVLVYFGGETIQEGTYGSTLSLSYVTADRLGSMPGGAKLDPYGQEITATANDKVKFATYLRDGESGIDYALNRYYAAGRGRFLTVDPAIGSAGADNPESWNRYSYVLNDTVNSHDPQGLCAVLIAGITQTPSHNSTDAADQAREFANEIGAITAYPYAGGTVAGGVANIIAQGMGIPTGATLAVLNAIALAAQNPGPINIYAFSGGAAAFTSAWDYLKPDIQQRIQSVTYIDPGSAQPLQAGSGTVDVWGDLSDAQNIAVWAFTPSILSDGAQFHDTGFCGHDWSCVLSRYASQLQEDGSFCPTGAGSEFGAPTRTVVQPGYYGFQGTFSPAPILWWDVPPTPHVTSTIHFDAP